MKDTKSNQGDKQMQLEYGFTKYQEETGRDGKKYRVAIRIRRIDGRVLGIRIDEVA